MGTCCASTPLKRQIKTGDPPVILDQCYSKQVFLQVVSQQNMNKLPYSAIGLIECELELADFGLPRIQRRTGTGCLISRNLVLTCAHILYKKPEHPAKEWSVKKLRFHPAMHGKSTESFNVSQYFYPFEFTLPEFFWDRQHDYALLKLEKKVQQREFLKLGQNFNFFNTDSPIGIYGYPYSKTEFKRDENNQRYIQAYQYGIRLKDILFPPKENALSPIISYKNFTEMGHSGSPIIIFTRKNNVLVAIHLGKQKENGANEGRLISDSVYSNLVRWQQNCQGDPFQRVILNWFLIQLPRPILPVNIQKPFEFNWNRLGSCSKCFLIIKKRIYKIIEGFSYVYSDAYLPQIFKLRIKIVKYEGYYFSIGITNNLNKLKDSARFTSEQSVVYRSDRIQKRSSIYMNNRTILKQNRYLFAGGGGIINLQLNKKTQTISFKNQVNKGKFSFQLNDIFLNQPLILFVILEAIGDSLEAIEGQ